MRPATNNKAKQAHRRSLRTRRVLGLAVCAGAVLLGVSRSHAVGEPGANVQTTYTVTGDLYVGNTVTLNLTLTNVGTEDSNTTAAMAWLVLPPALKRTNVPLAVTCESYRGHQGGLTQAVFNDFCLLRYSGSVPAGESVSLTLPVKLLNEGDYTTVGETAMYVGPAGSFLTNVGAPVRLSLGIHVSPAPPKVVAGGGGGGGGGGGTTAVLPDLQVTGRTASSTLSAALQSLESSAWVIQNNGKGDANDVVLTIPIASGMTHIQAYALRDGALCPVLGNVVTCSIGTIVPGAKVELNMQQWREPSAVGQTYATVGSAYGSNGDSRLSNNTLAMSVTSK